MCCCVFVPFCVYYGTISKLTERCPGSVTRPCPFAVTANGHGRVPSPRWYMVAVFDGPMRREMTLLTANGIAVFWRWSLRDGSKFTGYPGRVLGIFSVEKKFAPPSFFFQKKFLPPLFLCVKKSMPPFFLTSKKFSPLGVKMHISLFNYRKNISGCKKMS